MAAVLAVLRNDFGVIRSVLFAPPTREPWQPHHRKWWTPGEVATPLGFTSSNSGGRGQGAPVLSSYWRFSPDWIKVGQEKNMFLCD